MLTEIKIFCLNDHLLIVKIDLNILHRGAGQLDFICNLLAAVRRWTTTIQSEKHILCPYLLSVKRLENWKFTGIMFDDRDVCNLFLRPNLMFGVNFGLWKFLLLWLFGFGLILLSYFGLYFGIGFRDIFLFLFCSNCSRIKHTAFIRILNNIRIVFSSYKIFECHDWSIIHHFTTYYKYNLNIYSSSKLL